MIRIFDNESAESLAPLCCRAKLAEILLAGSTFGELLKQRWETCFPSDDCTAGSAFWPSEALLKELAAAKRFAVRSSEGELLAWNGSGPAPEPGVPEFAPDPASILIRYPWHVLAVNEELLSAIRQSEIHGTVRAGATVDGILVLGEGSVILPGVYIEGTAVVGKNCKIGPNCYLRGCNSIGDSCHIGQAVEVKNSIFQFKVSAGHLSYIGDSIVGNRVNFGAGTITSNFRHDGKNHRSMVLGQLVDTGRRKFGSVIGDGVHTGIHTSVYPGRKIWPDRSTLPGEIVKYDLN